MVGLPSSDQVTDADNCVEVEGVAGEEEGESAEYQYEDGYYYDNYHDDNSYSYYYDYD